MASKPPGPFPPPGTLKAKLVNLIPRANPFYEDYQARTTRDLPLIVLTPTGPAT